MQSVMIGFSTLQIHKKTWNSWARYIGPVYSVSTVDATSKQLVMQTKTQVSTVEGTTIGVLVLHAEAVA